MGNNYYYDGNDRRIAQTRPAPRTAGIYTLYTRDGLLRGGSHSSTAIAARRWNVYLGKQPIGIVNQPFSGSQTKVFLHANAQGSPVMETNIAAAVVTRTSFDPYGAPVPATTTTYEPYGYPVNNVVEGIGYTGHYMDSDTGLTYMQARYYDPMLGRFLSQDPVDLATSTGANFNRYWYANNNPYRFTDPDGKCPKGAAANVCIESKVAIDKADAKLDARGEKFAQSNAAKRAVFADKASSERLKAAVDVDGKLVARSLSNAATAESTAGFSAEGDPPAGTKFVLHGHVNKTQVDQPGLGDSQPALSRAGVPNVTISGDKRIGVREIENGRLQHRMLRGEMTETEVQDIQNNLDQASTIYNKLTGGGQ